MIDRMPKYSQAPVRNYLETGKFKDQTPTAIPAEEAAKMGEDFLLMSLGIMSQDNTEIDSNPAPGIMDVKDDFFGNAHLEFEASTDMTTTQGFATVGQGENGATVFARNTVEALDLVVVSSQEGVDDGVVHIDHAQPENSFMTFPQDQFLIAG